ncbi:MAG: cytochrome-c oxidase, cbb3-type subunit III [Panacagrimonas sp.]
MSTFWHGFVIVLTLLGIFGCLWLLFTQSRGKTGPETTHVWDDDLTEYNNPLPRWWLNMFILTAVFGIGYLVFYPGMGNLAGRFGWTSEAEMRAELDRITARRQEQFARLSGRSVEELSHDAGAQALGRSVFVNNCAGCHGTDARGAIGFPDLTDADWLYGNQPEIVLASIEKGRNGQMPGFNGALDVSKLDALLAFLPYWADPELEASVRGDGLQAFSGTCSGCHGADGKGNVALGAPNLTDEVWLWGGRREQIRTTILFGRANHMPSHGKLISGDEARVVAAYVLSLSEAPAEGAAPVEAGLASR